jgi:hypothetical protein
MDSSQRLGRDETFVTGAVRITFWYSGAWIQEETAGAGDIPN